MWGDYLHFVPHCMDSKKGLDTRGCTYHEAFNRYVSSKLKVKEGDRILELGCGSGSITRSIAKYTKAETMGITLSDEEIRHFKNEVEKMNLKNCNIVKGDYHDLPFDDNEYDASYAIYCLKYSAKLGRVFKEVSRVLKPGGRFVSYELLLTDKYDSSNKVHKELAWNISFLTGMPPLYTITEFRKLAEENGLRIVEEEELSTPEDRWYYDLRVLIPFANLFWYLAPVMEKVYLLPAGFSRWYKTHIYTCFYSIFESGRLGILSGSRAFILSKAKGIRM
jgi:ubiquinone/menaquinone biosynthesis C-methylase UbiE